MIIYSIYSLTPAVWGDRHRFVESFDTEEDARKVLRYLESVNVLMNCYRLIEEKRYAVH